MHSIARLAGVAALGATLLAASTAAAEEPLPACLWNLLADEGPGTLGLARVVGDQRAYFQSAPKPCGGSADRDCRGRQYVVKGDIVLTGPSYGAFNCAFFPNDSGGADGWIPASQLAALPVTPTGGDWTGNWTRDDWASLRLTAAGAEIAVEGDAMWQGANPEAIHSGYIEGKARIVGDTLKVGDEFCHAALRRIGPYLAVTEEGCGGMNVSFTGIYRRDR